MDKLMKYSIFSGICFILFEGIFWKAGDNMFDCYYWGCSTETWIFGAGISTILALIFFVLFIFFVLKGVKLVTRGEDW